MPPCKNPYQLPRHYNSSWQAMHSVDWDDKTCLQLPIVAPRLHVQSSNKKSGVGGEKKLILKAKAVAIKNILLEWKHYYYHYY